MCLPVETSLVRVPWIQLGFLILDGKGTMVTLLKLFHVEQIENGLHHGALCNFRTPQDANSKLMRQQQYFKLHGHYGIERTSLSPTQSPSTPVNDMGFYVL